jgi:hypothetical protein
LKISKGTPGSGGLCPIYVQAENVCWRAAFLREIVVFTFKKMRLMLENGLF